MRTWNCTDFTELFYTYCFMKLSQSLLKQSKYTQALFYKQSWMRSQNNKHFITFFIGLVQIHFFSMKTTTREVIQRITFIYDKIESSLITNVSLYHFILMFQKAKISFKNILQFTNAVELRFIIVNILLWYRMSMVEIMIFFNKWCHNKRRRSFKDLCIIFYQCCSIIINNHNRWFTRLFHVHVLQN